MHAKSPITLIFPVLCVCNFAYSKHRHVNLPDARMQFYVFFSMLFINAQFISKHFYMVVLPDVWPLLAHQSRRLTGELIGYPWIRRPSVRRLSWSVRSHFQTSSPLKPLGQSKPIFIAPAYSKVRYRGSTFRPFVHSFVRSSVRPSVRPQFMSRCLLCSSDSWEYETLHNNYS